METTIKRSVIENFALAPARSEWTDAIRTARYHWLSELPGLAFGLITLAYIVTSLVALV